MRPNKPTEPAQTWIDHLIMPIRRGKIWWRLLILFAVSCLIPIWIFTTVYRDHYVTDMRNKVCKDSQNILEMVIDRQNAIMDSMNYVAAQLAASEPVQTLLRNPDMDDYQRGQVVMRINEAYSDKQAVSPLFKGFWILDAQGELKCSLGYNLIEPEKLKTLAVNTEKIYPERMVTAIPETQHCIPCVVLAKAINIADFSGERIGYLILVINEKEFAAETYASLYPNNMGEFLFIREDGTIVSSENEHFPVGYPLSTRMLEVKQNQPDRQKYFECNVDGQLNLGTWCYDSLSHWYGISFIKNSYITDELSELTHFVTLLSVLCTLFGFAGLLVISTSIVRPTNRLVQYCQRVADRTGPREITDTGKDEIGYLTREISRMVHLIDCYNQKNIEDSIERKNLEIKMLQAQINPHFLFNTLNSIKWVAVLSRVPAVADSLSALAGLLKNTIINKDEFISLGDEIENIRNYALIQSLRYTEQFAMEYEIDEQCSRKPILKFLLQPVVENAMLYGVENVDHIVVIRVRAKKIPGGMRVEIIDDGAGFDVRKLDNPTLKSKRLSGIGISNVRERIRLVYGEQAKMVIESTPSVGTKVTMELPDLEENSDV